MSQAHGRSNTSSGYLPTAYSSLLPSPPPHPPPSKPPTGPQCSLSHPLYLSTCHMRIVVQMSLVVRIVVYARARTGTCLLTCSNTWRKTCVKPVLRDANEKECECWLESQDTPCIEVLATYRRCCKTASRGIQRPF